MVNNVNYNEIKVYTICTEQKIADKIEVIGMSKEEENKYQITKAFADKKSKEKKEDMCDEEMDDPHIISSQNEPNIF